MPNKLMPVFLLFSFCFSAARPDLSPPGTLRIMSYNVRNAKGMDRQTDYDRVAAVIKAARPDLVAVEELDSGTLRSGGKFVLQEIAARCGYHYYYFPAIAYDGGKYGIGVLSREEALRVSSLPLPGREEARTLGMVEFRKIVLFAVHLSLTEADRDSSAGIINAQVRKMRKPVFLAGDFNAKPASTALHILKQSGWRLLSGESFTFPSDKPDRCIDYVFAGRGNRFRVKQAEVIPDSLASDHRPVLVELAGK
jgi:endonuclease/exonuclease/phosphatase family metal-dependent hydrolase